MLCNAAKVDHQLGAEGATETELDFLRREFTAIPSQLDRLVGELSENSGKVHAAEQGLLDALRKLTRVDASTINAITDSQLRGLQQLEQELLRRAQGLHGDLAGLDSAVKANQDQLTASLRSLRTLPERLSMGFDPDHGPPWLRVLLTDGTGKQHATVVPHILGLFDDRDPETPTMGRAASLQPFSQPTEKKRFRLRSAKRAGKQAAQHDDVRRMAAEHAELAEQHGRGNYQTAFTRAANGSTPTSPVGNRIILASLTGIPVPGRPGRSATGALLLVRPQTPGEIAAYLFVDGDTGFLDLSTTRVAEDIFAALDSVPPLDPIPRDADRGTLQPSCTKYSDVGKAIISAKLTEGLASGLIQNRPTIKAKRPSGLGLTWPHRWRKTADEAVVEGVPAMLDAYRGYPGGAYVAAYQAVNTPVGSLPSWPGTDTAHDPLLTPKDLATAMLSRIRRARPGVAERVLEHAAIPGSDRSREMTVLAGTGKRQQPGTLQPAPPRAPGTQASPVDNQRTAMTTQPNSSRGRSAKTPRRQRG
ncbi:MAG: hypothetical protein DLM55_03390 [Acidimicrobiales bacterium]|nr:MAG: hypothetical protein DLM55_03390 [Acidimicrobiales bacterium]